VSRYVPIYLSVRPGISKSGWYVKDTSVTDCVVTLGGHHMLRLDAQKTADEANRRELRKSVKLFKFRAP